MVQISPLLTRRQTLWFMGGLAGSLALNACKPTSNTSSTNGPGESSNTSAASGGVLWIGYLPLFIAMEKGFFAEGGLEFNYKVFNSNTEADVAFGSKKLQGVNNVTSEAISLLSKGLDCRIIQVADTSLGGDGILARNSITDIADFKDKEVAVELNGVGHFFLLQVLNDAGLRGSDIKIYNLTAEAAAEAYQAGRVDIAVTYSPHLRQANEAQADGRIIIDTSMLPTAIVDVYLFEPQFINGNPSAIQAYVNGIFNGLNFLETNKDEALAIGAKWMDLQPEEVEVELQGVELTSPEKNVKMLADESSDLYLLSHMLELNQLLAEQGKIAEPYPEETLKELFEPSFVQAFG